MYDGKRGLIRGEGLVTRISPDREPQRDDVRNFYEEPDIRVNSALIQSLGSRWPNNVDSDDSEDDDVLPQEECWTLPDDGWTLVERPQVKSRGVRFKTNVSNDARDGGIFEERNYYDALENFVDDSAMLKYKRKERRNTNVRVEAAHERREVTVDVPLPMYVQPDRLPVSTRDDVTPIVSDNPPIKEQTDLGAVSLSSDSGMHSVDGEWDCMSTYSGESDSIQSVKTVYGGVCQTDRPVVKLDIMDSKGVMDTLEGQYGDQGSAPSVSLNGHKSDIADMGDFSDEEEEQWEEIEPPKVVHTNVRTEFVVNDHRSFLSTIGQNSDIADMGDFSDEDNEDWDEVEKSKEYGEETLYNSENDSVTIKEREVESWPRSSVMGQCVMKEEVNSEDSPAKQVRITETTKPMVSTQLLDLSQECWTKGFLELAAEAKLVVANSATFGIMKEDGQCSPEVTMPAAQTDLRNLPCQKMTGAFTRLAEEALLVDVGWTTSEDMEEMGPQRCGFGKVIREDISWRREDIMDRSVDFSLKEAKRMPTSVVEEDSLLHWSIEECANEVRGAYARESQMPSHGPVVHEAESVFVATEFEVFIPVFVAEAVTTRVAALPTVGSDFQTGLSTAVGREDRCILGLDNALNKVGHVAGQLSVSTVPVEDLLYFSAVCYVLPHVVRSWTVCISTFFLSDDRGELPLPLWESEDRPDRISKIYVQEIDMRAQLTTKIHGVGPNGDRWDGIDISGEWYLGRGWVKPQPGDGTSVWPGNMFPEISGLESGPAVRTGPLGSHEDWRNEASVWPGNMFPDISGLESGPAVRTGPLGSHEDWRNEASVWPGNMFSEISGLESGPAVRTGPLGSHEDCRNVHPDRVYCRLVSVKDALIPYGHFDEPPALWHYMGVCYYIFSFLAISEKDFDRLYDLLTGIHDVMGLQALRPSSAVCIVMSVPDSNYVRIITPDEHVPTGFHEILIGMSRPDSVTRKVKDTRRVQTRDVKDVAPPGPNVVPESIPLSAQIPVKETVCTPTTHDRPVRVPIDEIPPDDDVMFDPMLGEWPVDTLSSPEEGTQKMTDGGIPCRPMPAAYPVSLVRKPPPKVTPSGTKLYGLRTRDKLVSKLKGRPIDGWEFEPLIHERPAHSGAEDESIGNKLVEDTESSTRPADRELTTDRSDRQPGNDTTSTGNLVDRQVPSITEDGQTQEEPSGRFQRLRWDPGVLSAPLSPNRVRKGHSQDMPAEGSLFDVSLDTPGYSMRPAGASVQSAVVSEPPPPNYVGFNNPCFGTPIAFAQCQNTAGMDTTTTLPVYNASRDCSVGVDQSSVPTIYTSGVTPDSIPWSTAEVMQCFRSRRWTDFPLCQELSEQLSTCRQWASGALRPVRVHLDRSRCRPAHRA